MPILLVVFQIGAVTLAVLAGVGSLALTRQAFELAVLHSRGFRRGLLLAAQAIQAVFAAIVAFPLGLLLGMGLAALASTANGPDLPGVSFPIRLNAAGQLLGLVAAVVGGLDPPRPLDPVRLADGPRGAAGRVSGGPSAPRAGAGGAVRPSARRVRVPPAADGNGARGRDPARSTP